jgi:hypothetical protein
MKTALKLCLLLFVVYIGIQTIQTYNRASGQAAGEPKYVVLRDAKLDWKWKTGGFGTVMLADFTIQNPTAYSFKDFQIKCIHYGASGTEIDSNSQRIYEVVGAKSSKKLKGVNMGFIHSQAKTSACELTDLVIADDAEKTAAQK